MLISADIFGVCLIPQIFFFFFFYVANRVSPPPGELCYYQSNINKTDERPEIYISGAS